MKVSQYIGRKLLGGIPLLIGVTFVSFLLMVYFGPDKTYELLGKNPSQEQIREVRQQMGYDQPFLSRYAQYIRELATLNLGLSESSGERVSKMMARTIPVSIALVLPGFVLGNVLGILFGLLAAWYRGRWLDKLIMGTSVVGMSISFLVIIIALQILLCTPFGLNLFPARGWEVTDIGSYFYYVTVPTLAIIFVTLGYNTRFYRAVMAEELSRDHIQTALAYGASTSEILFKHVLKNSLVPVLTRLMFSVPLVIISGSLLLESYFGIPGIGKATFEAITSGDQPILKAVVGLTAVLFVIAQLLIDILYRLVDPRLAES
ncbi:MAG: peptide/nickel transport system permease protein [Lysobacterales bacterium]|jgi:peptide/nickel transport system permease protein